MSSKSLYLAGQPRQLVLQMLRDNPKTVGHRFAEVLGISHSAEVELLEELEMDGLIRSFTCSQCSLTHIGQSKDGERLTSVESPPALSDAVRVRLVRSALDHIRKLSENKSLFPYDIVEVLLPHGGTAARNESLVHLAVTVVSARPVTFGERFSDEEAILLKKARETETIGSDFLDSADWLKSRYLGILGHPDPRVCIAVSGLRFV